jgi:alginate O-acetyltransferase complex protein AlgI
MVFSSVAFLFYFLPLVLVCFYAFGGSKTVLLIANLVFYAWGEPVAVVLLLFSIFLNYHLGLRIDRQTEVGRRKAVLTAGLAVNLLILIVFKYLGFLAENVAVLLGRPAGTWSFLNLALPLGISFYTFHALSYLIDVYRRDVPAESSLRDLTLYFAMFPQLVAGPIIRYKFIATELHRPVLSAERAAAGIRVFIIGLGQKVLIANTIAASVDQIFALPPDQLTTALAWAGTVGYTLQIYFDFGGYSLMAIGLALMIGFIYPVNFYYPYAAQSITDFWRRWHISLSSWFRDYVYLPLGGNRGSSAQTYRNLFIVFLLCGIWHGAAWNFVVWGLLHGLVLVAERAGFGRILARAPWFLRSAYTLLVVMVAWVFFRANGIGPAAAHLKAMAGLGPAAPFAPQISRFFGADVLMAVTAALLAAGPWGQAALDAGARRAGQPGARAVDLARICGLLLISGLVAMSIAGGAYNPFIYFRF